MALKTKLKTINGLQFDAAILVITALNDSRSDNYQYQAVPSKQNATSGKLFQIAERDEPRRNSQFQVSIFADEQMVKDGKPPVGLLYNKESSQPTFILELNDSTNLSRVEQAYEYLKIVYPDAKNFDLSEVGLR
jgi:hypothetical protein